MSVRLSILAVMVLGCTTTTTTVQPKDSGSSPQRVRYKPEVVYSSFGEVDFDHDNEVVQRYLADMRPPEVKVPQEHCTTHERTAREKMDGVAAKRECVPEPAPIAAPAPAPAPPPAPVKVLVDSIPEGIDIAGGKIQVAEGKGLSLVGRVKWVIPHDPASVDYGELLRVGGANYVVRRKKAEIVDELKHLARAASANLVLITFIDEKTDTAHGAAGLLFHVDLNALDTSKNRLGKVPTEI
jgi:hypothetical protein